MSATRILALLRKELLDLSRTRAAIMPGLWTLLTLVVPFVIAIGVPAVTGDKTVDRDITEALDKVLKYWPELEGLPGEARTQAFIFQQFLMMLVLVPITGSMALAAYSIIGEKQARTLEPLLATPTTTAEILVAKVLASFLPALLIEAIGIVLYFGGIGVMGAPGVLTALVSQRTALVLLLLAPLATLIALQIVVIASSRVNDYRTAQQFGTLIVLPVVAVLIAQGTGAFWLTVPMILLACGVLLVVWILLLLFGIAIFEREQILTRWK
jgi:ABC-2 type transport system permease protein